MPDLTKSQRQGEKRLREEAESRNQELSGEDRDRNLKWIVVGSRGEKRIIKGTEREDFRGHGGGRGRGGPAGGRGGGNNGPTGDRTVEDREGGIGNGSRAVGCEESGAETRQPNTGNNQPGPNSNSYYRNNSTAPTYSRNGNYNGNGGNNTNGYSYNGSNGNNGRGYGNNYSNGGYGYRNNNDNGYFRGGRGRPSISYSERGRDNYTSYRPAPTNGNGNGYRSRPWQETGARRKEGPTIHICRKLPGKRTDWAGEDRRRRHSMGCRKSTRPNWKQTKRTAEQQEDKRLGGGRRQRQQENAVVKLMYTNAQSLKGKLNELSAYAADMKPDFILVTESWCNPSVVNSDLTVPGHQLEP